MFSVLLLSAIARRYGVIKMAYSEDLPLPINYGIYPEPTPNTRDLSGYQYWYVDQDVHKTFLGGYQIRYVRPHWIFDFDLKDDALLFKLTWGGQ